MPSTNRSYSIRNMLLTWLFPLMAAFMVVAWIIHGMLLERLSRDFVHDRLHQEAAFLERQVRLLYPDRVPSLTAGSYVEEVFHHAFAIRVGDDTIVSPLAWKTSLEPLLDDTVSQLISVKNLQGRDGAPTHFLAYRHEFKVSDRPAVVVVAEDLSILKRGQGELHLWTGVVSLGLLLVLLLLVFLAVHLAMRPVAGLRRSLKALRDGQCERLDFHAPSEFSPLIRELNHLLDALDQRLERSRQAIANLSHSVKTPIAAVIQVLLDRSDELTPAIRASLAERLTDVDTQLEAEMRRARFAGPHAGKAARPVPQARELLWMLNRLYADKRFELDTDIDESRRWAVEEHDLNEIIGNLADNAGKWCGEQVVLRLVERDGLMEVSVTDDGPGIGEDALAVIGTRGMRLDQQVQGHGLGLSIVREVVTRYGGTVQFSPGDGGRGLGVLVTLPLPNPS